MKAFFLSALTAFAWLIAGEALAQSDFDDQRARSHFEAGTSYFQESRFEDAIREFREAYRLSERSLLLINIGLACSHALKFDEAIAAYQQYLENEPEAVDRKEIEARIEHLRKVSQQVSPSLPEDERQEPATSPRALEREREKPQSAAAAEQPDQREKSPKPESPERADDEREGSILPWIIGGAGIALIAGGSVTGALTLNMQSDLDDSCFEERRCLSTEADQIDTAKTMALLTDILLGTGIAAVVTGAVLLFVLDGEAETEGETRAAFACTTDGCIGAARIWF
ncbi:MAG: hypothetical protein JXA30_08170 [Deltaproteobacteria bacterium]|nr:hypothetical protein [Deltaproteobacteria bacterium]